MDPSSSIKVPTFSQVDLAAFHEAHFGDASIAHFESSFLRPSNFDAQEDQEYEEEDDGLGYYEDGVKRTLTDEQIAIFRHSEEEALRRAAEKAKAPAVRVDAPATSDVISPASAEPELEEGEEVDADGIITKLSAPRKNKKKKRKGGRQWQKEQKPDLRKRTWDVVETGLGTLDYDGMEDTQAATTNTAKRRQISYDD